MLNNAFIKSILNTYGIEKASIVETHSSLDFIIYDMEHSISLERWELMENALKDSTDKKINLLTYNQAIKHLGESYVSKGLVIQ